MLTRNELQHMAKSAALKTEDAELLIDDVQMILKYIRQISMNDLVSVEPMWQVHENSNVFRKDEVFGELTSEEIFRNCQSCENDFFKVPKIIECK